MKKKKIRNIALIIVAIGVIGSGGVGYYLYQKPVKDVAGIAPEYNLSAGALAKAFDSDENEATRKYGGEVIEVSGKISEITDNDSTLTFILSSGKDQPSGVRCTFSSAQDLDQLRKYRVGEQVNLKGKCTGKLFDVVLINCYLTND